MKKGFLVGLLVFCCSVWGNAQIKKGSILLGGGFGLSGYSNKDDGQQKGKSTNANFTISIGKAIKEDQVFGVSSSFSQQTNYTYFSGGYSKTKYANNSAGVFYRRYKKLAKDFYFFGEGSLNYTHSQQKNEDSINTVLYKSYGNGVSFNITPGISYRVWKKLNLEVLVPVIGMGYSVTKNISQQPTSTYKSFNINSNINSQFLSNLGIGFRFIF